MISLWRTKMGGCCTADNTVDKKANTERTPMLDDDDLTKKPKNPKKKKKKVPKIRADASDTDYETDDGYVLPYQHI